MGLGRVDPRTALKGMLSTPYLEPSEPLSRILLATEILDPAQFVLALGLITRNLHRQDVSVVTPMRRMAHYVCRDIPYRCSVK